MNRYLKAATPETALELAVCILYDIRLKSSGWGTLASVNLRTITSY